MSATDAIGHSAGTPHAMTIPPDLEAQILRYHHVEKWRVGTIARQLHVHRDTVQRVLAQASLPANAQPRRSSQIDPYLPFLLQTLEKFPKLTASRLFGMVKERGYPGGPDHFRHLIARHRPRPKAEAYLRLRTLPGEQAQVDWGHFGHLTIGRAKRPVMGFVMVLSYSRSIFLRFFLDARMTSFLAGHVEAFNRWNGVPRLILYDNLKSAVLERHGDAIRLHPTMLDLARHYGFEPRPVAVARGNEKGRVERAIRYVRDSFMAGRTLTDLGALNAEADAWSQGPAAERRCPEDTAITVQDAFTAEAPNLRSLPGDPFPAAETVPVSVGKTPYVRFDKNDYSVPHTYVRREITLLADPHRVRIVDGSQLLACHPRSFDKGETVEDPAHIQALADEKSQARQHRGTDRLVQAVPGSRRLLEQAATAGLNLRSIVRTLNNLLDQYGAAELRSAIAEALDHDAPNANAVRLILERRRQERHEPPPVSIPISERLKARDTTIKPHPLNAYDQLKDLSDD